MSKMNKILFGLLAVQAALMAVTWTTCQTGQPIDGDALHLIGFEAGDIIGFHVAAKPKNPGEEAEQVELAKKDDKWVIASADDYPADGEKVSSVIDKLVALKSRAPIATQAANHNALKVGAVEYGKKVMVKTKSESKSLVLGSGKGSSVHVRFDGDDDVYRSSGLSVWSVSSGMRSYVDSKYLEIDKDKINAVTLSNSKGTLTLTREGELWMLAELRRGQTLDQDKVKKLVEKLAKLTLNEPVGREVKPEYGLGSGAKVTIVHTKDDAAVTTTYDIGTTVAGGDQYYYAKVADQDYVVTLSKWNTKQAREDGIEELLKTEEKKE